MTVRRFRVALSFAGEKRDYVAAVARLLAERFGEDHVLYDKFHEAEFARWNLGMQLPTLYGAESDLVVPVLCPAYDEKRWTGWEWVHIYGLLTKADGHRVMPARFGHADVGGLSTAAGFIELDDKSPEQFTALILERLALNEGRPRDYYATKSSAKRPIPNNLPRVPYFFGREKELERIAGALAPDARGWGALIDGPGGIGKTTLAVRAAQLVPPDRFRRIIFLSSKERELTADGQRALGSFVLPTYVEMLNAIARELDRKEITKTTEAERTDLVLRAPRDEAVLLVMDNLETLPTPDRDQLFAFLNRLPQGTSAIVTSRRRADAGAVSVRLDRLDWEAAQQLIAELAKNFPRLANAGAADRRALYDDTGGNPLLIRWVAGQLGRGRCRTIGDALRLLRSPDAGNTPLEFIFGDLLDTFSAPETKVLAALTHFTLPLDVGSIAEFSGLNRESAQGALDDLTSRALVMPDLEERQFVIVPLVAEFLRRTRREVVADTGDRLEKGAYALILENGKDNYDRFPVLDAKWVTVAAALPRFLAGPNDRLRAVCDGLGSFLNFTGRWDEWLAFSLAAESRLSAAGDFRSAGWRAYQAGWVYFMRNELTEVRKCIDRAEHHWAQASLDSHTRAAALRLRGLVHTNAREYPEAMAAFSEAAELWRRVNSESVDVGMVLINLGSAKRLSGDLDGAERDYREALRIATVLHDANVGGTATGNLALLAEDRRDWAAAEGLAREALNMAEQIGRSEKIAWDCRVLAIALLRQDKKADALPFARRAVEIYTKLGSPERDRARVTLAECES